MSASDIVISDAIQDRSFAGLFAYSSNVPMKVFAGNEPTVPVSVLVDALDALQGRNAPSGVARSMQYAAAAHPTGCQTSCLQSFETCVKGGGDQGSCVKSANACANQCQIY